MRRSPNGLSLVPSVLRLFCRLRCSRQAGKVNQKRLDSFAVHAGGEGKHALTVLDERLEMWAQYEKYKPIRQKLDKVKPGKREKYQQEHRAELADFDAAAHFLKSLKESGEAITPKAWRAEATKLTVQKDADYQKMYAMRDEIKAVENLRKAADRLAREGQHQQKENER